jgi:hypothetical protein
LVGQSPLPLCAKRETSCLPISPAVSFANHQSPGQLGLRLRRAVHFCFGMYLPFLPTSKGINGILQAFQGRFKVVDSAVVWIRCHTTNPTGSGRGAGARYDAAAARALYAHSILPQQCLYFLPLPQGHG